MMQVRPIWAWRFPARILKRSNQKKTFQESHEAKRHIPLNKYAYKHKKGAISLLKKSALFTTKQKEETEK